MEATSWKLGGENLTQSWYPVNETVNPTVYLGLIGLYCLKVFTTSQTCANNTKLNSFWSVFYYANVFADSEHLACHIRMGSTCHCLFSSNFFFQEYNECRLSKEWESSVTATEKMMTSTVCNYYSSCNNVKYLWTANARNVKFCCNDRYNYMNSYNVLNYLSPYRSLSAGTAWFLQKVTYRKWPKSADQYRNYTIPATRSLRLPTSWLSTLFLLTYFIALCFLFFTIAKK